MLEITNQNEIRIAFWNVNGLRSIYSKGFVEVVKNLEADIVCVQEIKIQEDQLNDEMRNLGLSFLSGFSFAQKKGYSGVATYFRKELAQQKQVIINGIDQEKFDSEGRILIVSFAKFDLYNIYFPSGTTGPVRQNFKYEFLDAIYGYFGALDPEKQARAVIVGDFNICHREIDIHHPDKASKLELSGFLPEERAWMSKFLNLGFVDSFRHINGDLRSQYTWWSFRANARNKNLGWRIDYCLTSKALSTFIKDARIYSKVMGSDHCPITVDLVF